MHRLLRLSLCASLLAVPYALAAQTTPNGDPASEPGLPTIRVPAVASAFGATSVLNADRTTGVVFATASSVLEANEFRVMPTPAVERPGAKPVVIPPSRANADSDLDPKDLAPIEAVQDRSAQPFSAVTGGSGSPSGVLDSASNGASTGANASGSRITPAVSR